MYEVPNSLPYCPDCHGEVAVFRDHASGDTVCTQCARVLGHRDVAQSCQGHTDDMGIGSGRVSGAATTIPDPALAGSTQSPEASDKHTQEEEGVCLVLPRMRGAVRAAVPSGGGAMPKMRGAVIDKAIADNFMAATTIPYPASTANARSPEDSDNRTHEGDGACLVLPSMRGAVGAAVPSQGGAMPKMRGAVLDNSLADNVLTATTIPYPAEASDNHTHEAESTCLVLPRMRGAMGGAAVPSRGATPKMRGAVLDADAFHSIDDMAAQLGLAVAVTDHAKEVFRKLEHAKVFPRGGKCRNRQALYAACLHVACRAVGTPRTFKELASVTGDSASAGIKDIGRLVRHIKVHFEEEEDGGHTAGEMMMMVRAGDYVSRFGSLVGIGDQDVKVALEAARRLEKNLDVRRSPDSIAATIIYMAVQRSGAGKSFRDVSTATGVSELTIKDVYYRDLSPHSKLLFD